MLITTQLLISKNACREEVHRFGCVFGAGLDLTARNLDLAQGRGFDVRWAIEHLDLPEWPENAFLAALRVAPDCVRRHAPRRYFGQLSTEQFEAAAKAYPWTALRYVADRLSPEQFEAAAKADPGTALECCADRLSPEQFEAAAKAYPGTALECCAERLSPEQLKWCREHS